jgi:hypothetical protein
MSGGVYVSTDEGANWQPISAGLTDVEMRGIVADDASGALVVSTTYRGTFRSDDGGKTWHTTNVGLNELTVRGLAADKGNGTLTFVTSQGQYQLVNGAAGWQPYPAGIGNILDLLLPVNAYGVGARLPGGDFVWASRGGGELWARLSADLGMQNAMQHATIRQLPDGRSQLFSVWGAELAQTAPDTAYHRMPLAWMLLRSWVWFGFGWLMANAAWWWIVALGVIALALLLVLLQSVRLSRRFGVPLGMALFTPGRSLKYARPQALEKAWPRWERTVHAELYGYGVVEPRDLPGIPAPFRLYAMQHYADLYGKQRSVELQGRRLHSAARDQMMRWADAWQTNKRVMRRQGVEWKDRKHADALAAAFASALGLRASPARDVGAVRAYALQDATNKASSRVALLFVADNEALSRTVQNLASALDTLQLDGATGIVISLGRPGRDVDVTNQVRNAVMESDAANRMKVLSNGDVLDIMAASDPAQALDVRLLQEV